MLAVDDAFLHVYIDFCEVIHKLHFIFMSCAVDYGKELNIFCDGNFHQRRSFLFLEAVRMSQGFFFVG